MNLADLMRTYSSVFPFRAELMFVHRLKIFEDTICLSQEEHSIRALH